MQGISLENGVGLICGAACLAVAGFALLTLAAVFSSRGSAETIERCGAFAISVVAFGVAWISFWGSMGGLEQMPWPFATLAMQIAQGLGGVGAPGSFLQVQSSIVAVVIAFFAWRYTSR